MSAAEPAPPVAAGPSARRAPVIDIKTRLQAVPTGPERWPMTDTTPPARDGALARLAEHLEATFNAHRMTLSRPDTREVFELTLDIVQGMVDSALAQGVIDQAQHGHLKQMLAGIKAVPEVLA